MKRRTFIANLGATVTLAPGIALRPTRAEGATNSRLTKVNPKFLVTPQEVHAWHLDKDSKGGPTMTGSTFWKMSQLCGQLMIVDLASIKTDG